MRDMDRLYDALGEAIDNGEMTYAEAAEEWREAENEMWREINDAYWGD